MKLAVVKNIEYGRAHKVLKKAPAHRHVKCVELLKEHAFFGGSLEDGAQHVGCTYRYCICAPANQAG